MTAPRRLGHARLAVLLALAVALPAAAQGQGDAPVPVIVAPAVRGEMVDRVEALGTTRANESVRVTASVTEIVQELRFDDGQVVEAGAVLVVLDKAEEEADLRAAEAILAERRLAFERAQELESRQFAATAQLDERRAALLEAEAAIEAVRARIANRVIRAPFRGVVGLRDISPGALVEPGDLITTLDDLSVIKLDFAVPAVYLPTLRRGLPIVAKASAFGGREFTGEVSSIGSRVDPGHPLDHRARPDPQPRGGPEARPADDGRAAQERTPGDRRPGGGLDPARPPDPGPGRRPGEQHGRSRARSRSARGGRALPRS